MKKLATICTFLLVGIIIFYSCRKTSKSEITQEKKEISIKKEISFDLNTISNSTILTHNAEYKRFGISKEFTLKTIKLPVEGFKKVSSFISNSDILAITFYSKNDNNINFNNNDMHAISVYYTENSKRFHKLFIYDGTKYIEDKDFSVQISNLLSNHSQFIAFTHLKQEVNTILLIVKEGYTIVNSMRDGLKLKELLYVNQFLKDKKDQQSYPPSGGGSGTGGGGGGGGYDTETCGEPCTYGNPAIQYCAYSINHTYVCEDRVEPTCGNDL